MRAASFERIASAIPERVHIVAHPFVARRAGRAPAAFGFILELWDALRDAVWAVVTRVPHVRTQPAGSLRVSHATAERRSGIQQRGQHTGRTSGC